MKCARAAALAAATLVFAGAAHAEFKGGTVDLSYSTFTDDNDFAKYGASGQFDFQLGPNFGLQGDLALRNLDFADDTAKAAGLHAYTFLTPDAAVGAFYQAERLGDVDAEHLGLEASTTLYNGLKLQGYASRAFEGDMRGNVFGAQADLPLNQAFAIGGKIDYMDLEHDTEATRIAVNASYSLPGVSFYGEVGQLNADVGGYDDSEAFVGLGAKFRFGQSQQATFGERGFGALLPGF
ncbi:hypothetical protein V8J36_14115 [Frigidibacter sp. MR17.14]|uniref:hypothetical protein n=1 Tax=Frigidibacter sp. MR17.14 TaxID=3126509 RepID=UPI003012ECB9